MQRILELIKYFHDKYVFKGRVNILSEKLSDIIPSGSSVLDIGCGSGHIDSLIMLNDPSISIQGIDVMRRPGCKIHCKDYDGNRFPLEDSSVDLCMYIDVLHHTLNTLEILAEGVRVSSKYILVKDHLCENKIDFSTLKFMDWIGNRSYGVDLVYLYRSRKKWDGIFSDIGLQVVYWNDHFKLYPFPAKFIFGRKLHFITLLEKKIG